MNTIKSKEEISSLFSSGQRILTPSITFIVEKRENFSQSGSIHDHYGRVAFIAGKKLGNAVWRNRAKRRMRSVCNDLKGPWDDFDIVFLARKSINEDKYKKILNDSSLALEKLFSD